MGSTTRIIGRKLIENENPEPWDVETCIRDEHARIGFLCRTVLQDVQRFMTSYLNVKSILFVPRYSFPMRGL
jgi:hypothetical protein